MTPRLIVAPEALERVVLLTAALRTLLPLSDDEIARRNEAYMATQRPPIGVDLSTWRPAAARPMEPAMAYANELTEFRDYIHTIDNDLAEQVRIVASNVSRYYVTGIDMPPYYARRIAIILRKARQWDLEASFLDEWTRLFFEPEARGDSWFAERALKARALSAKANGHTLAPSMHSAVAVTLPPEHLKLAWDVVTVMRRILPPTEEECEQRRAQWESDHSWYEGLVTIEFGEAKTPAEEPPTPQASLDDLDAQLRSTATTLEHFLARGYPPAPRPLDRVAIILRRAKQFDCEAAFCSEVARICGNIDLTHYRRFADRAMRAAELAHGERAETRPATPASS